MSKLYFFRRLGAAWALLAATSYFGIAHATPLRFEAESCNLSNANTATAGGGYSGSGYVTDLTSEWSKITFERGYDQPTPVTLAVRYTNPTGAAVTHMAIYQGSGRVQGVSFPVTAAGAWATLSVSFTVPTGWQGVSLKAEANAAASVSVDYFDLTLGGAVPTAPGGFSLTAPAPNATDVAAAPTFAWSAAADADSYALAVSTQPDFSNPVIEQANLSGTSFAPGSGLAAGTRYYWKVTAVNAAGATVAANAGASFTTAASTGSGSGSGSGSGGSSTDYYVATNGTDGPGRGTAAAPWRTVAYAASQATAAGSTIRVAAGTYVESQAVLLAPGVSLAGAGQGSTTLTTNGPLPVPGVDQTSDTWKLHHDGALIQLISDSYPAPSPRYGSPTAMLPAADGNQTLSGFTLDGRNKQVKAGVWVNNRSNVTMHHVTVQNFQHRGAVFAKGDMWWFEPLPNGKWVRNTTVHDCTFTNNGALVGSDNLGNLCIGGLDGADIYNVAITDQVGYGIKFIHVGHFRNVKIHDCTMQLNEYDANWGEKIAIEMWNQSYGNEVYNIVCNTWLSFVTHPQLFDDYDPVGTATTNLKIRNVRMIDQDGVSTKEAIEAAHSGIEISDCYFQDKGFYVAIWFGSGSNTPLKNVTVRNNIFANVQRTPAFGFGSSAGVFVPDPAENIRVFNNVFDRMGNALQLTNGRGVDVRNNVFLNTEGADVDGGSNVTFTHNLKYHSTPQKAAFNVGSLPLASSNILGAPGFLNAGPRHDAYYKPASTSSLVVDRGTNVGLPFAGAAPDLGRWEFNLNAPLGARATALPTRPPQGPEQLAVYPNPTATGLLEMVAPPAVRITEVQVTDVRGHAVQAGAKAQLNRAILDLSHYPNAVYIVRLKHETGVITQRVVLAR